jgi:hypothetical protein
MSSAKALSTRPWSPYPCESRCIVAALETSAVKVEEMVYAPGLSIARHSHETANLLYIIAGVHWSGYSRGGDTCAPRTVRFLPAGEPHENYFPVESRSLQVELRRPIWHLAAEYGPTIGSPGELDCPSSALLGGQLDHEFRHRDEDSLLDLEGVILQLLLTDRQGSIRADSTLVTQNSRNAAGRSHKPSHPWGSLALCRAASRPDQPPISPTLWLHHRRVPAPGPHCSGAIAFSMP